MAGTIAIFKALMKQFAPKVQTTGKGFDKALKQRIKTLERTGMDMRVPIDTPGVKKRLKQKARLYKTKRGRRVLSDLEKRRMTNISPRQRKTYTDPAKKRRQGPKGVMAKLKTRHAKMDIEVMEKLRGYTPGMVPQTGAIRKEKGKVIQLLQRLGFTNPRGQKGRGMLSQTQETDKMGDL